MNSYELVRSDRTGIGVRACGVCKKIHLVPAVRTFPYTERKGLKLTGAVRDHGAYLLRLPKNVIACPCKAAAKR
jgi:hypothetical protein